MPAWVNRTLVEAPRNGTDQHTITFTPATAGNLLVLVIGGPVTHTVPAGWTRHAQGLQEVELSVYSKIATAGESSLSTTHNAANYAVGFVIYEFAAGSTMGPAVAQNGVPSGGQGPQLSGLSGTNVCFAAACSPLALQPSEAASATWINPETTTDVALNPAPDGTDGYFLAIGCAEGWTASTFREQGHFIGTTWSSNEQLAFAVQAVTSGGGDPEPPAETYTRFRFTADGWRPCKPAL